MRPRFLSSLFATFVSLGCLPHFEAKAIFIELDYTYDTFFTPGSAKRARLEDAAQVYEGLLEDDLDAITPTGTYAFFIPDAWRIDFKNPSDGTTVTVDDRAIAADTLLIYVGAQTFSGGKLAEAGFGGQENFGGTAFKNSVETRGETGVGTSDFAPWGGYLSIDDDTTWDTSIGGNGTDQHLYSTLLHEIGHILGIGTAPSWDAQINGSGDFTGIQAVADQGGNVPLNLAEDHWGAGITSNIYGTSTSQEVSLDPDIDPGDVKLLTHLDVAALADIGWEIAPIPEPSQTILAAAGLLLFLRRRR